MHSRSTDRSNLNSRIMRKLHLHLVALLALLVAVSATVAQERSPQTQERTTQERTTQERSADRSAPRARWPKATACCGCCPAIQLPIRRSTSAGASSPTPRPRARCRSTTRTASAAPRCSTPPMCARAPTRARRPVTFVFNGGPGAASAFLHLGLAGPRIVDFGPEGRDGAAARLVDNPDTWLAFTDLVMIDPVGTGWSRPAKSDGGNAFWNVRRDAESIAKFIALYVAHNSRLTSPKYLLGESYGGFRAAKVARALQGDQGIIVSGIVMVSPLIETSFLWGGQQFALGAALHFPSLVASELERTKTFTPRGDGGGRALRVDRLSHHAGRPAADRRAGDGVLRSRRADDRPAAGRGRQIARLRPRRPICGTSARKARRSAPTTAASSIPDPFPESEQRAQRSDARGLSARAVRRVRRATRATSSASRPT